jgi:hypothetical protein
LALVLHDIVDQEKPSNSLRVSAVRVTPVDSITRPMASLGRRGDGEQSKEQFSVHTAGWMLIAATVATIALLLTVARGIAADSDSITHDSISLFDGVAPEAGARLAAAGKAIRNPFGYRSAASSSFLAADA